MPIRAVQPVPEEPIVEAVEDDGVEAPPPTPVEPKPKKPRSAKQIAATEKMRNSLAAKQREFARLQALERKQKRE
eukprot:43181-Eustigmatos_ZCMA.PRE.1